MTTTPIFGFPLIASQQAQPEVSHNEAVLMLQALQAGAIAQQNAPPVSPASGDVYIVGTVPTGDWAGRPNRIALYYAGAWLFLPGDDAAGTPLSMGDELDGLLMWNRQTGELLVWTGLVSPGGWVPYSATLGGDYVSKTDTAPQAILSQLVFPVGSAALPSMTFAGDQTTGLYHKAAGVLGFATAGVERGSWDASGLKIGLGAGIATHNFNIWDLTGVSMSYQSEAACAQSFYRLSANSSGPIAVQSYKGRGSWAAAAFPNTNDILGDFLWGLLNSISTGPVPQVVIGARQRVRSVAASPSGTDAETDLVFALCPSGSVTLTDTFGVRRSSGLSYDGTAFLTPARHLRPRQYAAGSLPSVVNGDLYASSDVVASLLTSDGTNTISPGVRVLTALTANGTTAIPAGWAIESIFFANSTANAVTGGIRIGTTGGASDVVVAQAVGANALGHIADAALLKKIFSRTVSQTLFIEAVTSWNSASVQFSIVLRKVY